MQEVFLEFSIPTTPKSLHYQEMQFEILFYETNNNAILAIYKQNYISNIFLNIYNQIISQKIMLGQAYDANYVLLAHHFQNGGLCVDSEACLEIRSRAY